MRKQRPLKGIPKARAILHSILHEFSVDPDVRQRINRAIGLMYREPYARKAPAKRMVIDKKLRLRVIRLCDDHPTWTIHHIANVVGLRSSGRVSEILHGKR